VNTVPRGLIKSTRVKRLPLKGFRAPDSTAYSRVVTSGRDPPGSGSLAPPPGFLDQRPDPALTSAHSPTLTAWTLPDTRTAIRSRGASEGGRRRRRREPSL